MTIKQVKQIRKQTKHKEVIASAAAVLQTHNILRQFKYKLSLEREIYKMLLAKRLIKELRPMIHETSEKIRIYKIQVKNAQRLLQKDIESFNKGVAYESQTN